MRSMVLFAALFAAGCVPKVPVDLLAARPSPEVLGAFGQPRPCALTVAPVTDARPLFERAEPRSFYDFKTFVPAILLYEWELAGPVYAEPDLYAVSLGKDLTDLVTGVLTDSRVCSGAGPALTIVPILHDYYGVSYQKSMAIASYGAASTAAYIFLPAGHVALELRLMSGDTQLQSVTIVERYLYNPDDPFLVDDDGRMTAVDVVRLRRTVPREALRRALLRVPIAVDKMIAGTVGEASVAPAWVQLAPLAGPPEPGPAPIEGPLALPIGATDPAAAPASSEPVPAQPPSPQPTLVLPATFLVVRVTREYAFEEEMRIETATGRIVTDRVVPRRLAVQSAPDEWVVAPVDEDGHWLAPEVYASLVSGLAMAGYDVGFRDNLSAASFGGLAR